MVVGARRACRRGRADCSPRLTPTFSPASWGVGGIGASSSPSADDPVVAAPGVRRRRIVPGRRRRRSRPRPAPVPRRGRCRRRRRPDDRGRYCEGRGRRQRLGGPGCRSGLGEPQPPGAAIDPHHVRAVPPATPRRPPTGAARPGARARQGAWGRGRRAGRFERGRLRPGGPRKGVASGVEAARRCPAASRRHRTGLPRAPLDQRLALGALSGERQRHDPAQVARVRVGRRRLTRGRDPPPCRPPSGSGGPGIGVEGPRDRFRVQPRRQAGVRPEAAETAGRRPAGRRSAPR